MNPEISGTWTSFFPNLQFARNYSTDSLEANPIEISLPIVNVSVTGDEFTSDGAATVGSVATVTMSIELPEGTYSGALFNISVDDSQSDELKLKSVRSVRVIRGGIEQP